MRKLLLATAAIVGASVGTMGLAMAQAPETLQGTVATPANGGSYTYGDNNYMGGTMTKGPVANPTPGTMVIRLGVRADVGVGAAWSSIDEAGGTTKLNPVQIFEYLRIYPGVDAMAANGLRYGAAAEIRQNYSSASGIAAVPGSSGAGVGGAGTSPWLSTQTLFVRRAFAYVAADDFGIVRLGEMDGLMGTYDEGGATTGVFLSPSGTIVGGNLQSNNVSNAWMAPYFGAQSGAEYGAAKIVYLTPSFFGFDFGLEYAPSQYNGYAIGAGANPLSYGCASGPLGGDACVNASATAGGEAAYTNFVEVGGRYQHTWGPVAILGYATYTHSGVVQNSTGMTNFNGLDFFQIGTNVTVAGISVFGNLLHGTVNGDYGVNAVGAVPSTGFGTGVKYSYGPYTIGALYSQLDDQGAAFKPSGANFFATQRHAWVFAAAATYSPAPGLTFYLDYDYGQQHQGDFNFATGSAGSTAYNDIKAQGVMFGTVVKW